MTLAGLRSSFAGLIEDFGFHLIDVTDRQDQRSWQCSAQYRRIWQVTS